MMTRRCLGALLTCIGAAIASLASAAEEAPWPSRQMQIIVPLPPGAAADTVARLIGGKLQERFKQTVVVLNRDGASGATGTREIAKAAPDGYTLGIATSTTLVTGPILNPKIGYDGQKDFTPVSMVGVSPYVLVTHPEVPVKTVGEFIALAKQKPDTLTYSSVGEASLARLAAELLAHMSGIKLIQVPYKSSTQAVVDVLGGRIDSQFGILTTTHQYIRDGKLNALGVTTAKRVPEFPDIPTLSESGLPGYEASLWIGVIAPANVPAPIVSKLNAAMNEILTEPEIRTTLFNQAIVVETRSPEGFSSYVREDFEKWRELAKKAGL
jgi:tripartite-type tricarboxylate transporter receptor subunit TctC